MGRNNSLLAAILACVTALSLSAGEEGELVIGSRALSASELAGYAARLNDPDDAVAIAAAVELCSKRSPPASAFRMLSDFYQHGNAPRRLAAVHALTAQNMPREKILSELLFKIVLGDSSQAVRMLAARQAMRLDGAPIIFEKLNQFVNRSGESSGLLRSRAVHSAALAGGNKSGPFLRALLADLDDDVALAAIEELSDIRELDNADALLKLLDSPRSELKTAALYAVERLSGKRLGFDLVGWKAWHAELLLKAPSGVIPPLNSAEYAGEKAPVDLVIAFDTTGSFLHVWPDVSHAIDAVIRELVKSEPSVRVGLVRYRSVDPRATLRYTLKISPLSGEIENIRRELATASFGGGSGALHEGLRAAVYGSAWRARARKIVLVIGDDSPSSPVENGLQVSIKLAHEAGAVDQIQINTLYAKTSAGEENRQTYRLIAAAGIGRFYEFNKAEKHLVEMSAEKVDVKRVELPDETARKWLVPVKP